MCFTLLTFACREEKEEQPTEQEDTATWWEVEEVEDVEEESESDNTDLEEEDKPEDSDDKPEDIEVDECPEGFDPTASCEGSWEETICMFEGLIWWCQDGVWLSEEDKE